MSEKFVVNDPSIALLNPTLENWIAAGPIKGASKMAESDLIKGLKEVEESTKRTLENIRSLRRMLCVVCSGEGKVKHDMIKDAYYPASVDWFEALVEDCPECGGYRNARC